MRPIRVLLVDDSMEFLDSAANFLATDARVTVVGRACGAWEGVQRTRELAPDLVLMDLVMPVMSGLAATRLIKEWPHSPSIVIVTMHDDAEYRRSAAEAAADGFITKSQFAEAMPALIDSFFSRPAAPPVPGETS